jgi:uncharacterized protein
MAAHASKITQEINHQPNQPDIDVAAALAQQSFISRCMIAAIRFYQRTLSLVMPPSCRFYPSCSEYTLQAIAKHGPLKGGWLGFKRILRCQPLFPGGYDPVP